MAASTSRRDARPSDPGSARATAADADEPLDDLVDEASDHADEPPSPGSLVVAGLIGAALGAGLGLLAGRAVIEERESFAEAAMRRASRARRDLGRKAQRAERAVRRGGSAAADDAGEALAAAVRAIGRTREEFGDRIERELRALRKLARGSRRRGWLR